MRLLLPLLLLASLGVARGQEVDPVAILHWTTQAWTGERVPFSVEVRAPGSFSGSTSFDLPEIPGSLLLAVGSPVVSSRTIDGEEYFVQTHDFALFSQRSGRLAVPPFAVRFSCRDGFTGPVRDVEARAPGFEVEIRRPPGSEKLGFLVTTESLEISESWEREPGPCKPGALFKRRIVQRGAAISGMALAPAPLENPDGLRIYPPEVDTRDQLARGEFSGLREETISYLVTGSGTLTIPGIRYIWWNPGTEKLLTKTLPSRTFEVEAIPEVLPTGPDEATMSQLPYYLSVLVVLGLVAVWQRRRVQSWSRRLQGRLNPPDKVAARALRQACRSNDPVAARAAWAAWRISQPAAYRPGEVLGRSLRDMDRQKYGPRPGGRWQGRALEAAFVAETERRSRHDRTSAAALPPLNP